MKKCVLLIGLIAIMLFSGCTQTQQPPKQPSQTCKGEGETIPVIANPPSCCLGLTLISPKQKDLAGILGICTAKCGDMACDSETETEYNCPKDCLVVQYHYECQNNDCVKVNGAGTDLCKINSDCIVKPKNCSEQGGNICITYQDCNGQWLNATDAAKCCQGMCQSILDDQFVKDRVIWDLPELSGFIYNGSEWHVQESKYIHLDLRYLSPEDNDQHSEFALNIFNSSEEANNYFVTLISETGPSIKEINGNRVFEKQANNGGREVDWVSGNTVIRGWNGNDIGTVLDNTLFDILTEAYLEKYPST